MPSSCVVPGLDVFEDGHFGLSACVEFLSVGAFGLQGLEEAFGHGIVPAVSFAAHAGSDGWERSQKVSELLAGVLNASVRMEQQFSAHGSACHGHVPSGHT